MTDDLLDEATRLMGDYREGRLLRALVVRVQQAESELRVARAGEALGEVAVRERDSLRFELDGARMVNRKNNEYLIAERDAARGKLDKVRDLATQWSEEVGDYVPPLPPDEPYNLMINHSREVLAILDGKTRD